MSEPSEPADFIRWLDQAHRQKICCYLRQKYVSLSETDIEDVWSETQKALFERWLSDSSLGAGQSLDGLLYTIADRRAVDLIRRADAQGRMLQRWCERERAKGLDDQPNTRRAGDRLEYEELLGLVIEAFAQLNDEQWLVLSVYCENYPNLKGPKRLHKAIADQFPEIQRRSWTPATVHRLLNQARGIVRKYLCEKGYDRDLE